MNYSLFPKQYVLLPPPPITFWGGGHTPPPQVRVWSSQVYSAVLRGALCRRTFSGMKGAVVRFPAVHVVQLLYVQVGQGALEVAHSLLQTEKHSAD